MNKSINENLAYSTLIWKLLLIIIVISFFMIFGCNNVNPSNPTPIPPTNLQVSVISCSQIDLSWEDNSDNEDGFKIERAPDYNGTPGGYGEIAGVARDETSFNDCGLDAGTSYYYRIKAFSSLGDSGYSNEVKDATKTPGSDFDQPTDIEKRYGDTDTSIIQNFPPLDDIINKPAPDLPVYGLYTWYSSWGDWYHRYDDINDVGWKSVRVGGFHHAMDPDTLEIDDALDETMVGLLENGNYEPIYTLKSKKTRADYGDGEEPDFFNIEDDQAFIDGYVDVLDVMMNRYGPGGTFFDEYPELPYRPILHWEIWNEPNLHYLLSGEYWDGLDKEGKADLYARLLIGAYNHIRSNSAWDDVKVVAPGVCGVSAANADNDGEGWRKSFVQSVHENLVEHGGHANYYDILSTHPYTHDVAPDTEHLLSSYSYSPPNSHSEIRESMEDFGNGDKPVWYTEVGWHRDVGHYDADEHESVTERLQAAYVSRLYLIAMRLGVERAHIMFVSDSDTFNGGFFNNDDRSWWEQTYAVNNMINLMPNPKLIGAVNDGGYGENDLPDSYGYYAYTFDPDTTVTGEPSVIVAWNVEGPITVEIPCESGEYRVFDMLGGDEKAITTSSQLRVNIGPCPIYIVRVE
ncbi:MAG: fibronectin type III domain-containing protein [Spirochaetota bacterium]|nr:fibronectin type III domain-containing protein [Spirochaetota bacterium]